MKVIPGPMATGNKFAFRVDSKTKIVCKKSEPVTLKTDKEKKLAAEYVEAGFLEEVDPKSK